MTHTRTEGDRLGPYELVHPLGRGAMGEVWEAVLHGPAGFCKPVALKLLRPERLDDPGVKDALVREARMGARLHHPNVVGTLGLSHHDDAWVVALELVRGASLATLLRHAGPLPARAVLEAGVQVAAGLDHAHGAGLVHRDVKPANVLVDRSGLVKVTDLGISVLAGAVGAAAGTHGYMPPEQADGLADPRSDQFALGVLLFVLATGRRPFGSGKRAFVQVRKVERLLTPSFLRPVDDAVPGLADVVHRCLRASPDRRWPSAGALGAALGVLASHRHASGASLLDLLAKVRPGLDVEDGGAPTPTLTQRTGNIGAARDRFVGRTDELRTLRTQLLDPAAPLHVIVGPGGMGKTRLALQAAAAMQPSFLGGAWLVDLSEARSEAEVCERTARVLGLRPARRNAVAQLGRAIAARGPSLWVLDNLEGCVESLPHTLGPWLDAAPEAVFLGTSRVAPGLLGERTLELGTLPGADARALFTARAGRPLGDDEAADLDTVCDALDGIPLALELAAARARVLTVAQIRQRLSLPLLAGNRRDRPARHRSLTASLDWSSELLSTEARSAWLELSVLESAFDLEAAEAVLDLPGVTDVLLVLEELVDASLVQVQPSSSTFSMLSVVREYTLARLPAEQRARAEARHGTHFAQLGVREAVEALDGSEGALRRREVVAVLDDLVAACRRAVEHGRPQIACATLQALWPVMALRGPFELIAALAENVLGTPGLTGELRAAAATIAGQAQHLTGRPDVARQHLLDAIRDARTCGARGTEGDGCRALGRMHQEQGRPDEARSAYDDALQAYRELGRRHAEGVLRSNLGNLELNVGNMDAAHASYSAALAIHQETGNRRAEAETLGNLGALFMTQGRLTEAEPQLRASYEAHRELHNRRGQVAMLCALGVLATEHGQHEQARAHYQSSLSLARQLGERRFEGLLLGNLGNLDQRQGRLQDARGHYQQALELIRALGNRGHEGMVLSNLAQLLQRQGDNAGATAQIEASLAAYREVQDRRGVAVNLAFLGHHQHRIGRLDLARAHLQDAIDDLRAVNDRRHLGQALGWLASLDLAQSDLAATEQHLADGEALLRETGDRPLLAELLVGRAELAEHVGDLEAARSALAEADDLAPELDPIRPRLDEIRGRLDR